MRYTKIISLLIIALTITLSGCVFSLEEQDRKQDQPKQEQKEMPDSGRQEEEKATSSEEGIEVINSDMDTSDWLTYRNEEYGFEISYPSDYKIKEDGLISIFQPSSKNENSEISEEGRLSVFVRNVSLDQFLNPPDNYPDSGFKYTTPEEAVLGDQKAYKFKAYDGWPEVDYIYYFVSLEKTNLILMYTIVNDDNMEKMVDTFQFLK